MKPITTLRLDEIFVFGSNLMGQHIGGAAATAHEKFGAAMGIGEGITGNCYALPTIGAGWERCTIEQIRASVQGLFRQAINWPDKKFIITPIGCGIAGFRADEIAPLFRNAPINCILPPEFQQ